MGGGGGGGGGGDGGGGGGGGGGRQRTNSVCRRHYPGSSLKSAAAHLNRPSPNPTSDSVVQLLIRLRV